MKAFLKVSVATAFLAGMGLLLQLNAQTMGTTTLSGSVVQQSGTQPSSAQPSGTQPPAPAPKAEAPVATPVSTFTPASVPADVTNRKALEQRAGKDAAKLVLQSVPSNALIYIDGMFVGRTPLLLIVPPAKYKVEMHGQRDGFGERLIGLLPKETQQLTLTLELRYPGKLSIQ